MLLSEFIFESASYSRNQSMRGRASTSKQIVADRRREQSDGFIRGLLLLNCRISSNGGIGLTKLCCIEGCL